MFLASGFVISKPNQLVPHFKNRQQNNSEMAVPRKSADDLGVVVGVPFLGCRVVKVWAAPALMVSFDFRTTKLRVACVSIGGFT